MLILTRKPGESLYIGDNIKITIVELKGHQIRVGIDAPQEFRIYREEIYLQILEENKKAAETPGIEELPLEAIEANWPEQGKRVQKLSGLKVMDGSDSGSGKGDDDDAEKDIKTIRPSLSGFFTSRVGQGGPQIIMKKKRKRDN